MKKLLVLLFSIFISFNSFGEWKIVAHGTDESANNVGDDFYIEKDTLKKHGGYIYFWQLSDYLVPSAGYMSVKSYRQGDCELNRIKTLNYIFYHQSMGKGGSENFPDSNAEWIYATPDSINYLMLSYACD